MLKELQTIHETRELLTRMGRSSLPSGIRVASLEAEIKLIELETVIERYRDVFNEEVELVAEVEGRKRA